MHQITEIEVIHLVWSENLAEYVFTHTNRCLIQFCLDFKKGELYTHKPLFGPKMCTMQMFVYGQDNLPEIPDTIVEEKKLLTLGQILILCLAIC